jgi:hypothetical protein
MSLDKTSSAGKVAMVVAGVAESTRKNVVK